MRISYFANGPKDNSLKDVYRLVAKMQFFRVGQGPRPTLQMMMMMMMMMMTVKAFTLILSLRFSTEFFTRKFKQLWFNNYLLPCFPSIMQQY
jgi:hypothetical protein